MTCVITSFSQKIFKITLVNKLAIIMSIMVLKPAGSFQNVIDMSVEYT